MRIVRPRAVGIEGGSIIIEDDCYIGYGSVVVTGDKNLVIGKHTAIGANSTVTKSIPPFSVAVGSPARVIKQYDFNQKKWLIL